MTDRVLVLEDEVFVALDIEYSLQEAGYLVDGPYATVGQGLAVLAERIPDCAVLDVRLLDGEVYPAAMRLRDAGVPIVFHSGHADGSYLAAEFPAAIVCGKPSAPGELCRAVATALAERASSAE